jgi:hypothetical protein
MQLQTNLNLKKESFMGTSKGKKKTFKPAMTTLIFVSITARLDSSSRVREKNFA